MATHTKWSVLTGRAESLRAELDKLERELRGMENTPCGVPCTGCGTVLVTEADFAKHFTVPDLRFLNLGDCPNR